MFRLLKSLVFCLASLLLFACEDALLLSEGPRTYAGSLINQEDDLYGVSQEDMMVFVDKSKTIENVYSYPEKDNPLLYVVNYKEGGYIVIPADKRVFPIIAESPNGKFCTYNEESAYLYYEYSIKAKTIREKNINTDETQRNYMIWRNILGSKPNRIIADDSGLTRYRYWIKDDEYYIESLVVSPLLETQWGQEDNEYCDHFWNEYCPWKNSTMRGERCPVGCVPVAAAQFAYYMKDFPHVCVRIPMAATCEGYTDNTRNAPYTQSFSDSLSTTYINTMPLSIYQEPMDSSKIEHARILLAYIGNRVGVRYGSSVTTGSISNLPALFSEWGITTMYTGYLDSLVMASLQMNEPVIVRGQARLSDKIGHAWVIDGFRIEQRIRRDYYYDSLEPLTDKMLHKISSGKDDSQLTCEETLVMETAQYHMNYGINGLNDGWVDEDNWRMEDNNYELNVDRSVVIRQTE